MNKVEWKCPRCGATPDKHGEGGDEKCVRPYVAASCAGFLCECEDDTERYHGETMTDRCEAAVCGHCGWSGTFPPLPKKMLPWEKKALAAGWTPPNGWGVR